MIMTDDDVKKLWSKMIGLIADRDASKILPCRHFDSLIDRHNYMQIMNNMRLNLIQFYCYNIGALQDPQKIIDKKRDEVMRYLSITKSNLIDENQLSCSEDDLVALRLKMIGFGVGSSGDDGKMIFDKSVQNAFAAQ